ncbi:MAG: HlyD family efflux transporter periplasmic adaptor subunit [Gammaproteobacteria bacterium]|nr:HlyD family efflux transporter periplasmic adaptor subunit [Gammaproteobacteria bacterium]
MSSSAWRRLLFWLPLLVLAVVVLYNLFSERPVLVDMQVVRRGPMQVTVQAEGRTRVREVFVVAAPVSGLMRRIDLHAGDPVQAGQTEVARIEPGDPAFLDVRSQAEMQARLRTAQANRELAVAELARSRAELEFANAELQRSEALALRDNISQTLLDEARRRARTSAAAVDEARAGLQVRDAELQQAQAALLSTSVARGQRLECDCVSVEAPVTGRVLRVVQESEAVVQAGEPLIEIGDPHDLEIVVDVLSADAVRVQAGQAVSMAGWGGEGTLRGRVTRVEPYGFTKVSALGIEEQRVNVIIELTDPPERWSRLGHGYRVEPAIVLWSTDSVLQVPLSALFRQGEDWAVFVVERGRARLRIVEPGRQDGLVSEIRGGLRLDEQVIVYPSDRIDDGTEVRART